MTEQASANGRFALGAWKKILSNQYSISQSIMDVMTAGSAQDFLIQMADRRTPPATPQPAPVIDRYSGPRLASNSFNTSHACRAATNRVTPHADKLNTIHSRRVTPKGLFEGMDKVYLNRIWFILRKGRMIPGLYPVLSFQNFRCSTFSLVQWRHL